MINEALMGTFHVNILDQLPFVNCDKGTVFLEIS